LTEGSKTPKGFHAVARVVVDDELLGCALIRELGFAKADFESEDTFLLSEYAGAIDLRPPGEHGRRGIQANFPPDKNPPSSSPRGGGRNPLVRAFGRQIGEILDLTAGLGGDAYRLAHAGHRVCGCERNPAVYAVLASGWERARKRGSIPAALGERLSFVYGEGADRIDSLEGPNLGVYIDPMYPPPRRSSAKPRRELQVLRALLGGQRDAADLVERAREKAARVVVKRPHHAEPLVPGASFEIETKLVRFDVYVNPKRMEADSGE
jgi:16S rRNA (guanine1516-N2)-methyltransferase